MSIIKKVPQKQLDRFLKDPLWIYLLGISFLTFFLVDSKEGYFLSGILMFFSMITIFYLYIEKTETLHNQVLKELSSFKDDFTVLSSVTLKQEGIKGYSDFVVISHKGIFNIRLLDFEGSITGYESENLWQFTKLSKPYDVTRKAVNNPIYYHQRSHSIIEDLLAKNNIRYIPIQSIIVIRDEDAEIITNSSTPIVKVKHLRQYISQYRDRHNMSTMLDEIVCIMKNQVSYC